MSSDNYTGPIQAINIDPTYRIWSFLCNQTGSPYVPLAVDINGVSYQIDSKDNLLRNPSEISPPGFCNVGIRNYTTTTSIHSLLGLPFFRSVYVYVAPDSFCFALNHIVVSVQRISFSYRRLSQRLLWLRIPEGE